MDVSLFCTIGILLLGLAVGMLLFALLDRREIPKVIDYIIKLSAVFFLAALALVGKHYLGL